MQFEWDERKRRANLAKHGLDFAALHQMFRANLLEEDDTRRDYGERCTKAWSSERSLYLSFTLGGVTAAV